MGCTEEAPNEDQSHALMLTPGASHWLNSLLGKREIKRTEGCTLKCFGNYKRGKDRQILETPAPTVMADVCGRTEGGGEGVKGGAP